MYIKELFYVALGIQLKNTLLKGQEINIYPYGFGNSKNGQEWPLLSVAGFLTGPYLINFILIYTMKAACLINFLELI